MAFWPMGVGPHDSSYCYQCNTNMCIHTMGNPHFHLQDAYQLMQQHAKQQQSRALVRDCPPLPISEYEDKKAYRQKLILLLTRA